MANGGQVLRERGVAALRGLGAWTLSTVAGLALFSVTVTAVALIGIGLGILLVPALAGAVRWRANLARRLAARWSGVSIPAPYRPRPEPEPGLPGRWRLCRWTLTDRAFWRDLLWLVTDPVVAGVTALLPAALIAEGVYGLALGAGLWKPVTRATGTEWYVFLPVSGQSGATLAALFGAGYLVLGLVLAERLLAAYARWNRVLLSPTAEDRLTRRVEQLTRTRSDAVDSQAGELRRIERDLHDGAQARLVAMGMSLGTAERLLDNDPERARVLLAEARETSATALRELRDLVRGIHPPVLADRGLADAVQALALDLPLPVDVVVDLPGRFDPAVESAAYFAVSEALANAAEHSAARRVRIDLRHDGGILRIVVTDDGLGGARPDNGTGLRGIERRIAAFDGILALTSPPGGPTTITMELPCASSSPKTSHS